MKINAKLMGTNGPVASGSLGRAIMSFADFKRKVSAVPMDAEVREMILSRVHKYPEASLDYVWKRLQDFVAAATRERAAKNRKSGTAQKSEPGVPVEKTEAVKPVAPPTFVRPSFNLDDIGDTDVRIP